MAAKIPIEITSDASDATRGIKQIDDQLDKLGATAKDTGKSFQVAGLSITDIKSGLDMVSEAAGPVIEELKKSIDAASDLNETMSKSRVVFGDAAGAIEAMGETAATALGMSKNEAISAAGTYGNLFTTMGIGGQQAAEMSAKMVQLAGDFASFNNIPVAEALDKIRAGLIGEAEPLRSVGVMLNQAAIEQEALNQGLWDGKSTLDAATKAQATYALILKQSTNAQGDFARTSEGAANQQKILAAQTANLEAELGNRLLPAYNALLKVMNEAASAAMTLATQNEKLNIIAKKHAGDVEKVSQSYEDYIKELIRADYAKKGVAASTSLVNARYNLLKGNLEENAAALNGVSQASWAATQRAEGLDASLRGTAAAMQTATDKTTAAIPKLSDLDKALMANAVAYSENGAEARKFAEYSTANEAAASRLTTEMQNYTAQLLYNQAAAGLNAEASRLLAEKMGLIPQSTAIALTELDKLSQMLKDKKITIEEYTAAVAQLDRNVRGLPDSKNVNVTVTVSQNGSSGYVDPGTGSGYGGNNSKPWQNDVSKDPFGGSGSDVPALASGGDFTVPPGYPNDSFPMRVQSGEHVTVTPAGQSDKSGSTVITLNFYGPTNSEQAKQGVLAGMRAAGKL